MVRIPSEDYQRASRRKPERLFRGLDAAVHAWIGRYQRRAGVAESLLREAGEIDQRAQEFRDLSDHQLRQTILQSRERMRRGGRGVETILIPALAAIREVAERQIGLRPFPVQLMGALALHRGYLAEMATGEGKTLTAGLAAILAGWTGKPCHIITVNDYLVRRDADWLKNLYQFCGIRVGTVTSLMNPAERRKGYDCDVTYATSKEVAADFLRDGLSAGSLQDPSRRLIRGLLRPSFAAREGCVLRGLHAAIIDEADSILIDEAVVPLIIASPARNEALREVVQVAHQLAEPLLAGSDYRVNARYRDIELTPRGLSQIAGRCQELPGIWKGHGRRSELIRQALLAREFYHCGKQYLIDGQKVVIIDEFTGRPMPQRTWRQGMHQAIEAKERLPLTDASETVARISFQSFFRLYHRLSGMTGTALEAASEFWAVYRLPVVSIPSNRPCIRREAPDRFFANDETKWQAVVEEIKKVHAEGRPVLVGTRSVSASENLASRLTAERLSFRLLNAVQHQEEAQIIADAGSERRITIATNMAGRGTDIKLGPGVAEMGGLHVIATERHESRRVDRQLFGRSARQGDPGTCQAFLSAEDELLKRYLPKLLHRSLARSLRGASPKAGLLARSALWMAQRTAQRQAYQQRCEVLRKDDWLEDSLAFAGSER